MQQVYTDLARALMSRPIANGSLRKRRSPSNSVSPHLPHKPARERMVGMRLVLGLLLAAFACGACSEETTGKSTSPWTQFVHVDGQPDPVPAQWVSTPEGKFAHSIKIPNPVPVDSGYRKGMSSKEYFDHLCKTEAGEFIFKTVDGVNGFYFMRPPKRPTDDDLKDRYKLEAPEIERTFQLLKATPQARAAIFVDPPWANFEFVEEPVRGPDVERYTHAFGRVQGRSQMRVTTSETRQSGYGVVWRGIKRKNDRKFAIAGSEWIVIELQTHHVLAVQRDFARTGFNRNTREGIWWLNASHCPQVKSRSTLSRRFYEFVSQVLHPAAGGKK